MPETEEMIEQDQGTETAPAVAPESHEVAELRQRLEQETQERVSRAEKEAEDLRNAMLSGLQKQWQGQPESTVDDEAELIADLRETGFGEKEAQSMARVILKREQRNGQRYVPKDKYEQDARVTSELMVDVKTRAEMERLESAGYAPEDVKKALTEVQKRLKTTYYPNAKAAFNDAIVDLGLEKRKQTDPARERKIVGRQQADMRGASRGASADSDAPIAPPKRLARENFTDVNEWLDEINKWGNTLTPEQAARVKWKP